MVAATARVGLTVMALIFVSRTVFCFLVTQALANVLEVLLTAYVARRLSNAGVKGRFNLSVVRRVWRFAVGFNLVGTFGALVSGVPQLLISKLLPLVELTYYSVASTATGALQVVYLAAQTSLFPRMSACWQQKSLAQMQRLYLLGLRLTVYLCVAPAMLLFFFPADILTLWTHSSELAKHGQPLLPILAIAILANCAHAAPLNVLLASGKTRPPLLVNAVSLPFMIIGCYFAIRKSGVSGAALCWLALNCICFIIYGRYCFKKIFAKGLRPILYGLPIEFLLMGGGVGFISKSLMPVHAGTMLLALWLVSTLILICLGGILVLKSEERRAIGAILRKCRSWFQAMFRRSTTSATVGGL